MEWIDKIRTMFPMGNFGRPCSEEEICRAERLLGYALPEELKIFYRRYNGFGSLGWTGEIFPLLPHHANTSTVKSTILLREEVAFPNDQNVIFFGTSCMGSNRGILVNEPYSIVDFDFNMDNPEIWAPSIMEAICRDDEWYVQNVGPLPISRRHCE
jgi:hypothetical protein